MSLIDAPCQYTFGYERHIRGMRGLIMAKFVAIGYGDRDGYDRTDPSRR